MNLLILDSTHEGVLATLNETSRIDLRLTPVRLADGAAALNPDLLADCGPDQTYSHYGDFLAALPAQDRDDVLRPQIS